jgi:hypothetical protein
MTEPIADQAIEIIAATRDGEDLDPQHLKLVELAVNGFLNENGKAAFQDLLANVRSGYVKPWFHGTQHITRDHQGYVYYKTHLIEHFDSDYAMSDRAKAYTQQLASAC